MKKYFLIGGLVTYIVIFNLGYVFHEIIMGSFFKEQIGAIQREVYIIPLIALAFVFYMVFQSYFLPIYYEYTSRHYGWGLAKTAIIFGAIVGFFWDGLQGGMIEVATFKMPGIVFWYDSGYHTLEGVLTALCFAFFYHRFVLKNKPAA
ncbi:MAG: hypothetical protein JWO03_1308 [Bacteroidetes bacterium]|nr:hypothetical protein [Bacteroidota bacterium]